MPDEVKLNDADNFTWIGTRPARPDETSAAKAAGRAASRHLGSRVRGRERVRGWGVSVDAGIGLRVEGFRLVACQSLGFWIQDWCFWLGFRV